MLIRNYADLHGVLPEIEPCDILIMGGDICPVNGNHDAGAQFNWMQKYFRPYCNRLIKEEIVGKIIIVPGNHDFVFEVYSAETLRLDAEILINDLTSYQGLSIYGYAFVPNLPEWAFHGTQESLQRAADRMPYADIWVHHGPPYMYVDKCLDGHVGNKHTEEAIRREKPKLFICGHIHEAFGEAQIQDTKLYNVAFVDEMYEAKFRHVAMIWNGKEFVRAYDEEINKPKMYYPDDIPYTNGSEIFYPLI